MHLVLKQRQRDRICFGLIYGTITLCALAASRFLPVLDLLPACVLRGATGIPCPTCGSTRALVQIANGHFLAALSLNPLFVLAVLAVLAWFLFDVITLRLSSRGTSLMLTRSEGTALRVLAALLFLGNWVYLVLRHGRP